MPFFLALLLTAMPYAPRERAVMIYPREHTWFFLRVFHTAHQRALQNELRKQYDVDVHDDVATADALFSIDVRGAKLLVLSGHGSPSAVSLDGRDGNDQATLTSTDAERLHGFLSQLAPDATIILQSCYTGKHFAGMVKEAAGPGRRVIAADGEVPRDGMSITSLEPPDVTLNCREPRHKMRDCTVHF